MPRLLIVAQNPKHEKNVASPFEDTQSGKVFNEWLERASIPREAVTVVNAYDNVGPHTYRLSQIKKDTEKGRWESLVYNNPTIITLGRVAAEAINLTATRLNAQGRYFYLPHPSGLNRQLNDEKQISNIINQLRRAYENAE